MSISCPTKRILFGYLVGYSKKGFEKDMNKDLPNEHQLFYLTHFIRLFDRVFLKIKTIYTIYTHEYISISY